MKKFLTLFLTLMTSVMLWAYDFQSGDLYYNITSNVAPYTVEVTSGNTKYSGDITIPSSVAYKGITYAVTSIKYDAFDGCSSLTSVTIPNSVTSIGYEAFNYTGIYNDNSNWENGVLYISNCLVAAKESLSGAYTIKNGTRLIAYYAFANCSSLTSVTIPNSVTSIGNKAFYGCSSLTSVTIPNSVTRIGYDAFEDAGIFNDNLNWENGVLYISNCLVAAKESLSGAYTIKNGTRIFADCAFEDCSSLTSVTIPNSVTSIGSYAFYHCSSLTSVTIPSSVTSIGNDAFRDCSSLTSVTIPSSVTSIGNDAFYDCSSLTSMTIPSSVTSIGGWAFRGCSSLTSVTIPSGVTSIGNRTFEDCSSLTSVTIPNSVTSIGISTFVNCSSLTSVTIPNSVTSIGDWAFENCSSLNTIYVEATTPPALDLLYNRNVFTSSPVCHIPCGTKAAYEASAWASQVSEFAEDCEEYTITYTSTDGNIVIPNKADAFGANIVSNTYENGVGTITFDSPITSIGSSAFEGCSSLTSVTIPNSVTSIGNDAFQDCSSLTSITIPNSVTSIGFWAFYRCSSLTSVTIPSSVTSIESQAFFGCSSLTAINVDTNNPNYSSVDGVLFNKDKTKLIQYPIGNTRSEYTIPNTVTSIGDYAFRECSSLTSITIPEGVISIGNFAFSICSSLTSIVVENGNTNYDSRGDCNAIIETASNTLIKGCKNTIIPNTITSIGEYAFTLCSDLTSIIIPNSVTSIGRGAFGCSSLTSVTIPNSVTSIGSKAFYKCSSLNTIYVEATTPPTVDVEAFLSTSISTCYIPCGTLAAYQASDWANYVGEFVETYEYTLTLSSSDNSMGSATITQEPACGTPAIIIATPNAGYLFSQWSDGNTDNPRTLSVTEDMKLTAQWTPNTNIPYIVNHYRQALDGTYPSALMETENLTGTTATNVTPLVKTYTGFTSPVAKTATIAADGSTVVEYYYTRNQYTLTWVTDGNALTGAYSKGSVLFEAAITKPNTPTKTGYTFAGWDNTVPVTMPATDKTFTATWTPNTNTPYVVKHYRQALDGTYPSALMETENLMGTTATNVTPVVKIYTGFTSPATKTATIAADGSTVVEYYYTRNKYTLTWVTDGNALTGAYSKGSVLFEAAITIPNTPTKTGYTFAGWDNTVPVTMPAEDVTLTALFTIHTYSVILTADQNGTVSGGGTYNYGESVTITATPNDGYTFSQWSDGNTDNPRTLTVNEDIELAAEFEEIGDYGFYSRTVRIGYNTICLPHGAIHFTGATFYEIAHILKNKKKIFFDEVKTLEAGKPYIFYPHSTEVTIYYDNTTSAVPLSHNGLHGTFDGITAASNLLKGKYLVAGNRMVLCGDGCSLAANRAYIVLDEISDKDHPAIPGIKRVSMDYSEENTTTALDNITDESIVAPMQEGVYDILGRKVDAPTVSGFYIINGKKVFVAL